MERSLLYFSSKIVRFPLQTLSDSDILFWKDDRLKGALRNVEKNHPRPYGISNQKRFFLLDYSETLLQEIQGLSGLPIIDHRPKQLK